MAAKQLLQTLIQENRVLVLSKSYCPYCKKAKGLLEDLKANAKVIEMDIEKNGPELQDAVKESFSHQTVPAVWVKQKFIGGCDDLFKANSSGELKKLLA